MEEVVTAVHAMGLLIPWFPREAAACQMIAMEFFNFVGDKGQLDWFVQKCITTFTRWDGLPPFRALYCTRFEPDDGLAAAVEFPGFTTDELEAKYRAREIEENTRKFDEYREKALSEPNNSAVFPLPEVKKIQ